MISGFSLHFIQGLPFPPFSLKSGVKEVHEKTGSHPCSSRQCPDFLAPSPLSSPPLQWLLCSTFWVSDSAVGSSINYDSLAVSNGLQMEIPVESPQGY